MTDTGKTQTDRAEAAARELNTAPANTLDGALGPNWEAWRKHVAAHVRLPDGDGDGRVENVDAVVPLLVYGDGPHDYIATNVGEGRVVVQDGNDKTGKAWQFPQDQFMRFVAHAQGKELQDDEPEKGDNPLVAAIEQQKRTNALIQADRDATAGTGEQANRAGRSGR